MSTSYERRVAAYFTRQRDQPLTARSTGVMFSIEAPAGSRAFDYDTQMGRISGDVSNEREVPVRTRDPATQNSTGNPPPKG